MALKIARITGTRGTIVSAAGPQMREVLHELALPSMRRYAAHWDWAVHAVDLASDGACADPGAQRAKWAKVGLLREALRSSPQVLWLDADVLLTRDDEDVSMHPTAFQALALEHVPHEHRVNPNTGVSLLRSCPRAFAFLDAVEQAGPQPGPWADRGAVLAVLGWDRGDERHHWARPRASPVSYDWLFGDGARASNAGPGARGTTQVSHRDVGTGPVGPYVVITWAGSYTVDGGATKQVIGTARTTGPPTALQVAQARSELVSR